MARSLPPQKTHISKILRGVPPEIRDLMTRAHDQGYVVTVTSNNHLRVTTPPGRRPRGMVHAQKTPSDYQGVKNLRAKLRRIGVEIPHQGR
jgi:hypothetical protein